MSQSFLFEKDHTKSCYDVEYIFFSYYPRDVLFYDIPMYVQYFQWFSIVLGICDFLFVRKSILLRCTVKKICEIFILQPIILTINQVYSPNYGMC